MHLLLAIWKEIRKNKYSLKKKGVQKMAFILTEKIKNCNKILKYIYMIEIINVFFVLWGEAN